MKKLLLPILLMGILFPFAAEAHHKGPRCKTKGKVVVCKMHRKHCTRKRPCIPPGYYRPVPPIVVPHSR